MKMIQQRMPMLGEARAPALVQPGVIATLPDAHQAVLLQIHLGGWKDCDLCDQLEIDAGHWSRMRTGTAHFPTRKLGVLQSLCGNLALAQYLLHVAGRPLGQQRHPLLLESA